MKKILLWICIILFTGCSSEPIISSSTDNQANSITQAQTVSFEKSGLRTYIDIFESKLFYMEMENTNADFYVYDFQTGFKHKIASISDFALKGRSKIIVDDTLYFYISTYYGDGMKNVLYAMDFSKMKMEPISENKYSQKLIPVIEMNKQIVALQEDFFPDGSRNIFLEVIKESGQIEQVTLNSNAASSFTDVYTEHNIIYIDSDNEYLYTLEKNVHASSAEYYIVKYTFNFSTVEAIDISSIFIDYAITDNIGVFYAFDNYFCITDYSGNSILCEYSVDGIDVLLCENDLEYVPNSSNNTKYEIFYVRNTNNIYRLDTQKGTLDIRNYDTENGQSVIRCVLAYGNMLIIVKNSLLETDLDEKIYFLSYEE